MLDQTHCMLQYMADCILQFAISAPASAMSRHSCQCSAAQGATMRAGRNSLQPAVRHTLQHAMSLVQHASLYPVLR